MGNWYDDALKNAKKIDDTRNNKFWKQAEKRNKINKQNKENEIKNRQHKLKEVQKAPSKTARGGKKYSKRQGKSTLGNVGYAAYEKAQSEYAVPKYLRNTADSFINNSITGTIHKIATDKPISHEINSRNPYNEQLYTGLSAELGQLTGQGLAFMTQSAMASPLTNKAATAFAGSKLGQALGGRIGTGLVTGLAENAIDAGTVGLAQNLGMAYGDGLRGEELAGQVLKDTAFDLGFGSAMEVAGDVIPKLANRRTQKRLDRLAEKSKKLAENGDFTAENRTKKARKGLPNAKVKAALADTEVQKQVELDSLPTKTTKKKTKSSNVDVERLKAEGRNGGKETDKYYNSLSKEERVKFENEATAKYEKYKNKTEADIRNEVIAERKAEGKSTKGKAFEQEVEMRIAMNEEYVEFYNVKREAKNLAIDEFKKGNYEQNIEQKAELKANTTLNNDNKLNSNVLKDTENKVLNGEMNGEVSAVQTELFGAEKLPKKVAEPNKANKLPKPKKLTKSISADVNKYGMEKTAADMKGNSIDGVGEVSQAVNTFKRSEWFADEDLQQIIDENVVNFTKTTKRNKVTLENVEAKLKDSDINDVMNELMRKNAKGQKITEEDIVTAGKLVQTLSAQGKPEEAFTMIEELQDMLTQAGRTLQSANIFLKMTPYGKVKSVKRLAKKLGERYGRDIKVDESLLKKLSEVTDEIEVEKVKKEIQLSLWDQVPPSFFEKLDALRYTAMLSSPKTHIRNMLGNAAMFLGKELSDTVETGLQKYVFKGKMDKLGAVRNKTVLNHFSESDRSLLKEADRLFEEIKDTLLNADVKYMEKGNLRPKENRVFKSKTLEASRKAVSGGLEWEDEKFMKANFKAAFAKICKANGLEVGELQPKELRQFVEFAKLEAQKATFRDPNALASALNRIYKYANSPSKDLVGKVGKGALKVTMDAIAPFIKTPANVLKQGVRYSPAGVVEGLGRIVTAKDADQLIKGIEALSNGLVGTPIVIGGYLAAKGLVATSSVGKPSDKKTKYDKALGAQDYSVRVGDYTITMDWLSPYSMPFFVGVSLGEALNDESVSATELVDALASITEPFLEMSMLQGVEGIFKAVQNKENMVQELAQNQIKTYVSQFVPALFQQLARTMSETARTSSRVNDGTSSGKFLTSTMGQLAYKVPGLHDKLEPQVDVWGRTENKSTAEDYAWAAANNLLNPSNVKKNNATFVDREILKIYDRLDDEKSSVIPELPKSKVEFCGAEYQMTDKEYTDFKKNIGKMKYDSLNDLFRTEKYKNASDTDKRKMIQQVYENANEEAKKNYLVGTGKMSEETYSKKVLEKDRATYALDMIKKGKTTAKEVLSAKRELKKAGASRKAAAQAYVLSEKYSLDTIRAMNKNMSDVAIAEGYALKKTGVPLETYEKAKANANLDGEGGIKKEEAIAYINSLPNLTRAQKHALFDSLMSHPDTRNPY